MSTLPVTVALVMHVHPLPATVALARVRHKNAQALNERLGQQRLPLRLKPVAHKVPRDAWQHRTPPQQGGGV
jgi:hypothetical protein